MPNKPQQGPLSLSSKIGKAIGGMAKKAANAVKKSPTPPPQQKKVVPQKTLGQRNIDAANAAQAAVDAEQKPVWKKDQGGAKRSGIVRK